LRLLASREHSPGELRGKLRARGYADQEIERLLDELGARGLVSEDRTARAYVEERARKGFGPVRIRQELRRKGLSDDVIEPCLQRSSREWREAMIAAHDKKFGRCEAAEAKEQARRARFLEYRGFPTDLIAAFLLREEAS
jgi:regulatory protein